MKKDKLDIIYEDKFIIVVSKPAHLLTIATTKEKERTLYHKAIEYEKKKNKNNKIFIVHRLDKDTSGLMLVAKNDYIHEKLAKMIQEKVVERYYLALVEGTFNHETGTIDAPIGRDNYNREKQVVTSINSKKAITHFKVLKRYKNYTLIECKLETGRTHQIRVHMAYINHPVVGDPLYGKKIKDSDFGQLLHSYKIKFPHPRTGKILEFEKEPPEEFENILHSLVD